MNKTEKEIFESNKTIAKYMGIYDLPVRPDFHYHDTWSYLMNVVNKLEMEYEISLTSQEICFGVYMAVGNVNWIVEIDRDGRSLMEALYKAVVETIKWHYENIS